MEPKVSRYNSPLSVDDCRCKDVHRETEGVLVVSENPWLDLGRPSPDPSQAESIESVEHDVVRLEPSGASAPQTTVDKPSDQLPRIDSSTTTRPFLVGVHGGAGESTLSRWLGWPATHHCWPMPPWGYTSRVVLVARTHSAGLDAAQAAIQEWASGSLPGIDVAALVTVADAPGRLPRALGRRTKVVGGGVPYHFQIGWLPDLRLGRLDPPSQTALTTTLTHLAALGYPDTGSVPNSEGTR